MPILDKAAVGGAGAEADKFWVSIIDPSFSNTSGWFDMGNWSIDGQDFVPSVNMVMTNNYSTYGLASGTALYGQINAPGNILPTIQAGWLSFYGKYSDLPQPIITDPLGNTYFLAWLAGDNYSTFPYLSQSVPPDLAHIINLEITFAHKILEFADLVFYNPFFLNSTYNSLAFDNYFFKIDFTANNGGVPLNCGFAGAAALIDNIIAPIFFNNTITTINLVGSRYHIKIENVYGFGAGCFDTNWRQGYYSP